MTILIGIGLFIWLVLLQDKVDRLSGSIRLLKKQIQELSTKLQEYQQKTVPEQTATPTPAESTPAETKPATPVSPQPIKQAYRTIGKINREPQPIKIKLENQNMDIQNAFLGNIFNKIGAVAIIIAAIIFIKLVSPFIVISPAVKIILGFIAGAGMVGTALYMHKTEKLQNYAEVLLGTGFAVLFITLFCGFSMFKLYNTASVLIFGGILLLLAYTLAFRMKTISMLAIALIGGYLTPFIAQANRPEAFGYLIFLNILSLIYTLNYKNKNCINMINLLITMIILTVWNVDKPINIIYPVILWACYLGYDLFREKTGNLATCISWINYTILTFFSINIFKESNMALGSLFAGTAFTYMVLAVITKYLNMKTLYRPYICYILINVWLFIFFILTDIQSIASWSVIAAAIILASKNFNANYLKKVSALYFISLIAGVLLAQYNDSFVISTKYPLFFNIRTVFFALPICSMLCSGYWMKNTDNKIRSILNFGALSLLYVYFVCEINSLLSNTAGMQNFNKWASYSILGFIYSLNMKRIALNNKSLLYETASYVIGVVATGILVCMSYAYPTGYMPLINLRAAAFITAISSMIIKAKWSGNEAYKYIAIFAGFLLTHVESAGITKVTGGYEYLISLSWVLYSGIVTICGIVSNRKYLINSGIAIIILAILRIFIFDLANVDALYKLIAFLALGILLMLVSYIYSRSKK